MSTTSRNVQHQVTQEQALAVTAELEAAANAIFGKHGLKCGAVSGSFGYIYSIKIEAYRVTDGGNGVNVTSKNALDWIHAGPLYATEFGFTDAESLLGVEFNYEGKYLKFVGSSSRRSKYPLIATEISTGTDFKLPIESLNVIVAKSNCRNAGEH